MALGLIQSLTEMSTRDISWGVKAACAWGWQSYHLHVPIVLKSGSLNLLEPSGHIQACNGGCFTFALTTPCYIFCYYVPWSYTKVKYKYSTQQPSLQWIRNASSTMVVSACLEQTIDDIRKREIKKCLRKSNGHIFSRE